MVGYPSNSLASCFGTSDRDYLFRDFFDSFPLYGEVLFLMFVLILALSVIVSCTSAIVQCPLQT